MAYIFKKLCNELIYFILRPFGTAFTDRKFPALLLLKQVVVQKIFRINSHVPWPVHWTSQIKAPENIERGTRFPGLAIGCYLDGRNGIKFGKNVWVGPKVSIISMNHDITNYHQYVEDTSISIGDNCWLGSRCIILPSVILGNHIVVAAGAVVTKSFENDNLLLAGVPAKVIKKLPPYKSDQQ